MRSLNVCAVFFERKFRTIELFFAECRRTDVLDLEVDVKARLDGGTE
jgi:hypothetical protein